MQCTKGIILAGGKGSRLYPLTLAVCKPLLPLYDKPIIYYPLSILMLGGINDILIISTREDISRIISLLGDGTKFGIKLSYEIQEKPEGIAQAFIIGEKFINNEPCALILGDNIFYGSGLSTLLKDNLQDVTKATIFGYAVKDPERFGIVEFDKNQNVLSIEEKPKNPKSNYCVTGLYIYPNNVVYKAKTLTKSKREEYEITDLNNQYLNDNNLKVNLLGRGYTWFDVGTPDSLLEASNYIKLIEDRGNLQIGCPEEIAYNNGWITKQKLLEIGNSMSATNYGRYLISLWNK